MSVWDEIGAEIDAIAKTDGGPCGLYKPVLRIEIYEHDDEVRVELGRCKSMDEIVATRSALGGKTYPEALLETLRELRSHVRPRDV